MVEQKTLNLLVEGSNPSGGTTLLETLQSAAGDALSAGTQALMRLDWIAGFGNETRLDTEVARGVLGTEPIRNTFGVRLFC